MVIFHIDPQTQQYDAEQLRVAFLGTDVLGVSTAGNRIELTLLEGSTYDPLPVLEAHVARDWHAISAIKRQITDLEATVTPRRLREATLGADGGWLAALDAQIQALRQQLPM